MSYPKLYRRLIERKRPVTIYLSRGAFEGGVTRHLARGGAAARADAVLYLRLSSEEAGRTAQQKDGGRSSVECVDAPAASETEERFIPSCQIVPGISLDGMDLAAVALH
ncbi:MAG TPA: hypothetical protein VGV16_00910 [Gammaproteobacteria bacterium]|nr:hypothetical protein [Gammaproteobacteria bacterium]